MLVFSHLFLVLNISHMLLFTIFLKVSKKYVSKELAKEIHAKAAPFVKWLKEAEEESEGSEEEEEEEDDENVEVVYSSSARELKVETVKPDTPEKEEDDIDIDAI
ncbi:Eukaryotic translation initiation factor 5A-1 [Xenotaenia resolanae]|uniref:Eukaryotic translation initiation factor 5A-1 n=1 Tax=Xenotaenia resolanae TaxID=208358 RepID=A0ABV0WIU3_9TELE